MIIHINGMPGVGKLTVARVLAEILPGRLIDNHLILDLVSNVCGRGSPEYIPMINDLTAVVHQTLIKSGEDETVIFTNALARESPEDEARLEATRALAAVMKKPFVPILIHCGADENARRLVSTDRHQKRKLRNVDELKRLRAQYEIAHPMSHPHAFSIDTTTLPAREAARRIAEHTRRCWSIEPA